MNDNQLYEILIPIIQNGLNTQGYTGVPVIQLNQPTQEGVSSQPTIYITKTHDERFGFVQNNSVWDDINNQEVETDSQIYIAYFQISALTIQDPNNITYTASDLLNITAMILNSFATVRILAQSNLGVLRIDPVQNPYFVDDKVRFEALPNFEVGITYTREITQVTNIVENITGNLYPLEG